MISARKEYAIGQILKNANDLEIKGKIRDAVKEVKKAVDLNPEDGNLYNRLGDLYMKLDEKEESIVNFRKGVEAFRRDNFLRNALALSKKILRYEPDGFDMYYTIADLHAELDEKQDAAQYIFEYIDKQADKQKKNEIINAIDYLKGLELRDEKFLKRIAECQNLVQKGELDKIHSSEIVTGKTVADKEKRVDKPVASKVEPQVQKRPVSDGRVAELIKESNGALALRKDIGQLDASVRVVEQAVISLKEAIRLDEVASTLKDSLGALSGEQKKALGVMQQSITENLDKIDKSVKSLYGNSEKSMQDLRANLDNLNKALASLSKNQANIAQQLNTNLTNLNVNFKTLTDNTLEAMKSVQENYEKSTDEMCCRLDDTKDASGKLVKATDAMKQELSEVSNSLSKYMIAQETKEKKRDRYITIILVISALICGLFVVSIIFK
jgi:tetratricopeptide (TPR) repeat protein